MNVLSIVVYEKYCYASTGNISKSHYCEDIKDSSEKQLALIEELANQTFDTLILSSGPGTFTSMRLIGSIAKGIKISCPDIKITSISTFLTLYFSIAALPEIGILAIDSKKGDYYCINFNHKILSNQRVCSAQDLNNMTNVIYGTTNIPLNINLADMQINLLSSDLVQKNSALIHNNIYIDYGTKPIYKI